MCVPISGNSSSDYNNYVCAAPENLASYPPEETLQSNEEPLMSIAPSDSTQMSSVPQGQATQTVPLYDENASYVEEQMCTEERTIYPNNDSGLEADLNIVGENNKLKVSGNINVSQGFLQKQIEDAVTSNADITNAKVTYNSENNSYTVNGNYSIDYLPDPPISFTIKAGQDGKNIGLQVLDSSVYLTNDYVGEQLAESLSRNGMRSSYNEDSNMVIFDTNSMIKSTGHVGYSTDLDLSNTNVFLGENPKNGDLILSLDTPGVSQPYDKTNRSDISVTLDEPTLKSSLERMFGPDLKVNTVDYDGGEIKVDGQGRARIFEEVASAGAVVGFLLGMNPTGELPQNQVFIDTQMNIAFQGNEVVLKPESQMHVNPLAEALRKRHYDLLSVNESKKEIRFSINELLPEGTKGKVNHVDVNDNSVSFSGEF